jgi:predicted O-methyltransferase YrrM
LRRAFKYFYPNELTLLKAVANLVLRSPCVALNIGAGAGTSGLALLESRSDLILHTVDIQDTDSPFGCLYAERQVCRTAGFQLGDRWLQHHMDSKRLAAQWTGPKLDLCFIDGGHEYDEAVGDILGWLPHMKDGGFMAVHDYRKGAIPQTEDGPHPLVWEGVDQAVDEFLRGKYAILAQIESLIVFQIEK